MRVIKTQKLAQQSPEVVDAAAVENILHKLSELHNTLVNAKNNPSVLEGAIEAAQDLRLELSGLKGKLLAQENLSNLQSNAVDPPLPTY